MLATAEITIVVLQGLVASVAGSPGAVLTRPTNARENELRTCAKWQIKISTQTREHKPWTHAPYCLPDNGKAQKMCVYTDVDFNNGKGLSIVAMPEVAEKLIDLDLLRRGPVSEPSYIKYEAIEKPGLGIGLYVKASEKYKAGEIIMREYPTLIAPSGSVDAISAEDLDLLRWRALLQLPDAARQRTRALARSSKTYKDEIVDILDTNAFTHQKAGVAHDIIFPEAARMNHNCVPNAVTRTNETTLAMEVVALRDIHPGEEIAHSYLDPSIELTSYERRNRLSSGWDFTCQCSLCSSGKAKLQASNRRRREISRTKESLNNVKGDPGKILEHAQTLLKLYNEEGMILPKAYYHALAAHACMYLGNNRQALRYSREAKLLWDVIFGEGSEESKDMVDFQSKLGKI
ncbi:hypothetical protein V8F20_002847 [Naviculisporaceae sp. PSN 640]